MSGDRDRWASASSLGINLPEPVQVQTGETEFSAASDETGFYTFRYGVSWELPEGRMLPVTVTILVDPQELQPEIQAFRSGLWQSLGLARLDPGVGAGDIAGARLAAVDDESPRIYRVLNPESLNVWRGTTPRSWNHLSATSTIFWIPSKPTRAATGMRWIRWRIVSKHPCQSSAPVCLQTVSKNRCDGKCG